MTEIFSIAEKTKEWVQASSLEFWFESSTESTNSVAKEEASSLTCPEKIYFTNHQSQGRGRKERLWIDTAQGDCLLGTWSFAVKTPPQHITAPLIGLALFKSVKQIWPKLSWSLHPPNDLYLQDKKIGGILTESISYGDTHRLLIGIGFNVFDHPKSVENAGHLTSQLDLNGPALEKQWLEFLNILHNKFRLVQTDCLSSSLSDETRKSLVHALNLYPNKPYSFIDISPNGDLISESGTVSWSDL